jgi:hypothetical protein
VIVFLGGGTNVAIPVEIGFQSAVVACDQGEAPDVELAPLVKQRVVNVLLKDHGAGAIAATVGKDQVANLVQVLLHLDAVAPVRILARLDDPDVLARLVRVALHLLGLVVLLEFGKLGVIVPHLDVEGQGQRVEHVLVLATVGVIVPHVYK